jgi:hypothetical protein
MSIDWYESKIQGLEADNRALHSQVRELEKALDYEQCSVSCIKDELLAAQARITALEARLEMDSHYDQDGNEVVTPPELRDKLPDGIECRDATIGLLEDIIKEKQQRITQLEADRDEWKRAAELNKGTYEPLQQRITQLERINAEQAAQLGSALTRLELYEHGNTAQRITQLEGALIAIANRYSDSSLKVGEHDSETDTYPVFLYVGGKECAGSLAEFYSKETAEWFVKCIEQAQHALTPGVYREWCRDPNLCQDKGTCPKDPTCSD